MANNRYSDGLTETFLLGSGETTVKVGQGYPYGKLVGIVTAIKRGGAEFKGGRPVLASEASAEGDEVTIAFTGSWRVAKTAAQAWGKGVDLYWDDTAKSWTTTTTSNTLGGKAQKPAQTADTVGVVRLNG